MKVSNKFSPLLTRLQRQTMKKKSSLRALSPTSVNQPKEDPSINIDTLSKQLVSKKFRQQTVTKKSRTKKVTKSSKENLKQSTSQVVQKDPVNCNNKRKNSAFAIEINNDNVLKKSKNCKSGNN